MYRGPFGQILVVKPVSLPPPKKQQSMTGQFCTTLENYHPSSSLKVSTSGTNGIGNDGKAAVNPLSPISALISEDMFGLPDSAFQDAENDSAFASSGEESPKPELPVLPISSITTNTNDDATLKTSPTITESHPHHVRDRSSTLVASSQRPFEITAPSFDFVYSEKDTQQNEINEFFNYHDFPLLSRGKALCLDDEMLGGNPPDSAELFEWFQFLSSQTSSVRIAYGSRLLYYSQGWFSSQQSVSEQLVLITNHNQELWKIGAFPFIYEALRHAVNEFESSTVTPIIQKEVQTMVDLYVLETNVYLSLLFMMLQSVSIKEEMKQQLFSSDPPFVPFLCQTLNRLAEGSRQHFPTKKLLIVLWRVLLAFVGNEDEYKRLKQCNRKQWGLPSVSQKPAGKPVPKARPQEYSNYHTIASHRYPTYYLPDPLDHLNHVTKEMIQEAETHVVKQVNILSQCLYRPTEQFPCPEIQPWTLNAPTFMPPAISEAVELFKTNMHISTSQLQIAKEKERLSDPKNRWLPDHLKPMNTSGLDCSAPAESEKTDPNVIALARVQQLHESLVTTHSSTIAMLTRLLYFLSVGPQVDSSGNPIKLDATSPTSRDLEQMSEEERNAELERLDLLRHREVATKAVSAILFLMLRIAKLHHALSFEYVSQLLVDNNCTMLILKMISVWFPNLVAGGGSRSAGLSAESPSVSINDVRQKDPFSSVPGTAWLKALPAIPQLNFFSFCRSAEHDTKAKMDDLDKSQHHSTIPEEDEFLANDSDINLCFSAPSLSNSNSSSISASHPPTLLSSAPFVPLSRRSSHLHMQMPPRLLEPSSFRNFFTAIHLLRILHMITKGRKHRTLSMVQWKAPAVLKRVLKINHGALILYALKLLKEQIPYLGKKWRGNNMKAISLIFLHLRPNLREDYLAGEIEMDSEDALVKEQALRSLIASFHRRMFRLEVNVGDPGKDTFIPQKSHTQSNS